MRGELEIAHDSAAPGLKGAGVRRKVYCGILLLFGQRLLVLFLDELRRRVDIFLPVLMRER